MKNIIAITLTILVGCTTTEPTPVQPKEKTIGEIVHELCGDPPDVDEPELFAPAYTTQPNGTELALFTKARYEKHVIWMNQSIAWQWCAMGIQ